MFETGSFVLLYAHGKITEQELFGQIIQVHDSRNSHNDHGSGRDRDTVQIDIKDNGEHTAGGDGGL